MSDDQCQLSDLFKAINSVYLQCADLVRDTIRFLREDHDLFFEHQYSWDFTTKPNDHLLSAGCKMVTRAYLGFRDTSNDHRGIGFCFEFCELTTSVTPSVLFGTFELGNRTFSEVDRWPLYNTIRNAESGDDSVLVEHSGSVTKTTGRSEKCITTGVFTKVPLKLLTNTDTLRLIIVAPLAELHNGRIDAAQSQLANTTILEWPQPHLHSEEVEDEDDPESL